MQKESSAERERRFQEQYKRNMANAPIFAWPTKLLILLMILGGGGYFAFHHFRQQLAEAFPNWIKENVGERDGGSSALSSSASGIKLAAAPETISDGAIGDQLLKDNVILSIIDTKTIELNNRGVAVYVVSAILGNGGKKPMNCPDVEGVMYDTDDRQYAAIQKEGQYSSGLALNPLLCLDQRWAFIVPEGVTFKRFELMLPSHNIITVDLTRRTPENSALIAAAERTRMQSAQDAFASRIADLEDRKRREEETRAGTLAAIVEKTSVSRTDLATKLDAAMAKRSVTEKNVQKLQKRVKSMENLVNSGQAALDKWNAALAKAKQELQEVQREYYRSNPHDRMRLENPLQRAKDDVDLQDSHVTDALSDVSARKVKLNDANLELVQETRNFTVLTNDVARMNAELEKLDDTLQENQKKMDEMKAQDASDTPTLTPLTPATPAEKALPPPPPPPPDPGDDSSADSKQ